MTPEENRRIALAFIKSMVDREGKIDENMVTGDFQWWVAGVGFYDRKSHGDMVAAIRPHLAKWYQFTPTNTIAEGDQVAVEMDGCATMAAGKSYSNKYSMIFKLRNGRICSIKEYYDTKVARDFYSDIL